MSFTLVECMYRSIFGENFRIFHFCWPIVIKPLLTSIFGFDAKDRRLLSLYCKRYLLHPNRDCIANVDTWIDGKLKGYIYKFHSIDILITRYTRLRYIYIYIYIPITASIRIIYLRFMLVFVYSMCIYHFGYRFVSIYRFRWNIYPFSIPSSR